MYSKKVLNVKKPEDLIILYADWCLKNIFKQSLTKQETKTLLTFLTISSHRIVQENTKKHEKTFKFHLTKIFKKLKPVYREQFDLGKSAIVWSCMYFAAPEIFIGNKSKKVNHCEIDSSLPFGEQNKFT